MQFLVLGYDGSDERALERRLAVREQHLAGADRMKASGQLLFAAAIVDDDKRMVGSAMIVEMPSRAEVDAWLEHEPYVRGGVWKDIVIHPCQVAPAFAAPAQAGP